MTAQPYTCICGKHHTAQRDSSNDKSLKPSAGDMTICNRCGTAYEFNADGSVSRLDESKLDEQSLELLNNTRKELFENPNTMLPRDRRL